MLITAEQLGLLTDLLSSSSPPFVFIHDPLRVAPSPAAHLVGSLGSNASIRIARIDGVECFSPKMLFDAILNQVTECSSDYGTNDKAYCWNAPDGSKWDKNWDLFSSALREAYDALRNENPSKGKNRNGHEYSVILLVDRAERLREHLPQLFLPLTRLRELARIPITTVFISSAPWTEFQIPFGSASSPYMVALGSPSKQDVIAYLAGLFPNEEVSSPIYQQDLRPLYHTFLGVLYDSCVPYTSDPRDVAYVAYAMWPTFVRPLLEDWNYKSTANGSHPVEENGEDMHESVAGPSRRFPSSSETAILIRQFTLAFPQAFPALHSRQISASAYQRAQAAQPSFRLSQPFGAASTNAAQTVKTLTRQTDGELDAALSRRKKLMLVAAYICSFNPARTDLRLFGRVAEGPKRGRKGGPTGRTKGSKKISQVLLGPNAFTLERYIAVYGALVAEHGVEDADAEDFKPGELEVEVHRSNVLMTITELVQLRLLLRIGSVDKIDKGLSLKCNISFDSAEKFAKELHFSLTDLLWDPVL